MIKVQRVHIDKQYQDFDVYESTIERDDTKLAARIEPNFFGQLVLDGQVSTPVFGVLEPEDIHDLLELVKAAAYDHWYIPQDGKFEISYDPESGSVKGVLKNGNSK